MHRRSSFRLPAITLMLAAPAFLQTGCDIPRDPEDTLERVSGSSLYVGVTEHAPWVVRRGDEPAGVEVELVQGFARSIGATPVWLWGHEQGHMEALERYELDLLIGGLTDKNPWKKRVGLSRPYFESRIQVGAPEGIPAVESVHGIEVATRRGSAIAALLERRGAIPRRVVDPFQLGMPVAAPDWELEQRGWTVVDIELQREKHVMAVPPGENRWLSRLEDYLETRRSEVRSLLQRQETARR